VAYWSGTQDELAVHSETYQQRFDDLMSMLADRLSKDELSKVRKAYHLAEAAHHCQLRDEGTPYILHPIRVAMILVEELHNYSSDLICGALLHDVIEDSETTREQIEKIFGKRVARIVWLLTKFDDVSLPAYLAAIEAAPQTGSPIVKLCDRLDNLRFLVHSPRAEKRRRYIRTTTQHYLPMAARTDKYLYDELCKSLSEIRSHVKSVPPTHHPGRT